MKNLDREKLRKGVLRGTETAFSKAEDQYDRINKKASEAFSLTKEKAIKAKDKTEEHIREHPMKSIFIAAGIGTLVGLIASKLMSKGRNKD